MGVEPLDPALDSDMLRPKERCPPRDEDEALPEEAGFLVLSLLP